MEQKSKIKQWETYTFEQQATNNKELAGISKKLKI